MRIRLQYPTGGESPELATIRQFLQLVLLAGMGGLVVELLLLEHFEERQQFIPFIALGTSMLALAAALLRPGQRTLRVLRIVMAALLFVALLGIYFHFTGNREFELEMEPELAGRTLIWKALTGATPALAPGTLALLGLVGLISTYRHPALRRGGHDAA
jgi:hypothetical protein